MRKAFIKTIEELIEEDPLIYLLIGDVGGEIYSSLKNSFPKNVLNIGINEQATIGLASGMALEGLKPYVYSITPFILERPFEQIKLDLIQQKANVKLIGYWDYPNAGPTHFTAQPEEICRILGLKYFAPKNSEQVRQLLKEMHKNPIPAFFYLTKEKNK